MNWRNCSREWRAYDFKRSARKTNTVIVLLFALHIGVFENHISINNFYRE